MGINDLVCYSNLVQDIKDLLTTDNLSIQHTLREDNQSADYMAKLKTASDVDIIIHSSPPADLLRPLRSDTLRITSLGTSSLPFSFLCVFLLFV